MDVLMMKVSPILSSEGILINYWEHDNFMYRDLQDFNGKRFNDDIFR